MKRLTIEWRHLDVEGNTCERCSNTGASVRSACEILAQELGSRGWQMTFKEVLLDGDELPESNMILINGIPMEELLPKAEASENCCGSCCQILGAPTQCRTIERQGRTYETIPVSLILEAVNNYIKGR